MSTANSSTVPHSELTTLGVGFSACCQLVRKKERNNRESLHHVLTTLSGVSEIKCVPGLRTMTMGCGINTAHVLKLLCGEVIANVYKVCQYFPTFPGVITRFQSLHDADTERQVRMHTCGQKCLS